MLKGRAPQDQALSTKVIYLLPEGQGAGSKRQRQKTEEEGKRMRRKGEGEGIFVPEGQGTASI